jgi:metallo-beta-lactamase family protein
MKTQVHFVEGAGSVTGAHFILEFGGLTVAVDCGLKQGGNFCEDVNYDPFPYDPTKVDILFITHGHLDHIGRIAKFVKEGFSGPIISTLATRDITAVMLADAVGILTQEAAKCDKEPMYTRDDVARAMDLWQTHDYHEHFEIGAGVSVQFKDAGHILGSAMVEFTRAGKKFVCTGDLGNSPSPLLRDTESVKGIDYILMESVYGDRVHEHKDDRRSLLREAIERIQQSKGTLLIPSFSIERTQVLLSEMNELFEEEGLPTLPVFLDSPLAAEITRVYTQYPELFNAETKMRMQHDDVFSFPGLTVTVDNAESGEIENVHGPKIIIAGSGMSHGGRIRAHERRYLGDTHSMVLFVGFQVPGSLGRRIQDGNAEVTIDGSKVAVRCMVGSLSGYSAHKDRDGLVGMIEDTKDTVKKVLVAMGEPKTSLFLAQRLREHLGVDAIAPSVGEVVELDF